MNRNCFIIFLTSEHYIFQPFIGKILANRGDCERAANRLFWLSDAATYRHLRCFVQDFRGRG